MNVHSYGDRHSILDFTVQSGSSWRLQKGSREHCVIHVIDGT